MEVMIPVSGINSTPSSPRRFGQCFFTSAPTSPTRLSEFYSEFDNFYMFNESSRGSSRISNVFSSTVPFDWEEKPGTPKSPKSSNTINEDDFAFDFCKDLEATSLSAEELFDGGKIRPLKPPPRLQQDEYYTGQRSPLLSPRSPRSPRSPISHGKRIIREAFSPRTKKEVDPFATAIENTRNKTENERGRDHKRVPGNLSSSTSRRPTRSLSPYRVSAYPWEEEDQKQQQQQQQPPPTKQLSSLGTISSKGSSSSRKWRLRDFLLFRSASEGRAKGKDQFSRYASFFKKNDDTKNSSFRSTDSSGSGSGSGKRRAPPVSAHELHYTKNKAASEDLKKKTFLPYKQGILGSWVSHTFRK
ncbi:hypothetical protein Dsin_003342 [Dipteronia sinensis]|uniref:Uncharacterized protein n=1 Tax=Dipteronia sinensis TaxID=43782 RepID=A0AAE0B7H6_9ROSI|nr:hypothetical protein Dsin_003342 [Dipteronia sinensis]